MEKGISVIICCYNSEKLLSSTLAYLAKQQVLSTINWEIILVDNASSDNTASLAISEWKKYNLLVSFRVVKESNPGLNNARVKGTKEAQYEYLVFCDDDNWLDANYINNAYRIMTLSPNIGVCGGYGKPVFENNEKPSWFSDKIQVAYALGPQAESKEGSLPKKYKFVYGAGMTIRKSILQSIYNADHKPILSGRKENVLLAGDDSELCCLVMLKGYEIWYSSSLTFFHFLPKKRLTEKYLIDLFKGFGNADIYMNIYYSYLFSDSKYRKLYKYWFPNLVMQTVRLLRKFFFSSNSDLTKYSIIQDLEGLKHVYYKRKNFHNIKNEIKSIVSSNVG